MHSHPSICLFSQHLPKTQGGLPCSEAFWLPSLAHSVPSAWNDLSPTLGQSIVQKGVYLSFQMWGYSAASSPPPAPPRFLPLGPETVLSSPSLAAPSTASAQGSATHGMSAQTHPSREIFRRAPLFQTSQQLTIAFGTNSKLRPQLWVTGPRDLFLPSLRSSSLHPGHAGLRRAQSACYFILMLPSLLRRPEGLRSLHFSLC